MANERTRFDYLDGMRGWAAFSVVVFHASVESFGPSLPALRTSYFGLLNDGRFAVGVFFALSGFVLSRGYIATQDRGSLQRMAAGRYVRLALPIGLISIIGYVMAVNNLFPTQTAGEITESGWLSHGMTFVVAPGIVSFLKFCVFNVFTSTSVLMPYNQFTWTMMYELCGSYMLFATLALFGDVTTLRRFAFVALCSITTYFDPLYGLFFGGALLAEANVAWARREFGRSILPIVGNVTGLVLVAFAWASSTFVRAEYQTVYQNIPALALLAGTLISPWMQAGLHLRASQWLGRISFPLYLVHGYVIFGPGAWAITMLDRLGLTTGQIAAIVVPGDIVLALVAGRLLVPVEHLAKHAAHYTGRVLTGSIRSSGRTVFRRSIPDRPRSGAEDAEASPGGLRGL